MKKLNELKELNVDALQDELLSLRKDQFTLRMKKANGSLDKVHHIPLVRKSIARVKTLITQKTGEKDGK